MKHTPEPWKADNNIITPEYDDMAIAECWYRGDWETARANAARIVACVNACTGIPNEVLKEVRKIEAPNPLALQVVLVYQRDRYKANAERLAELLAWAMTYVDGEADRDGLIESEQKVYDIARAALAAHERGEG